MPPIRSTYQRAIAGLAAGVAAATPAGAAAGAPAGGNAQTLVVRGAGDGHGVGMSQWGALGYARHGYDYRAILVHYYSGTALAQASPTTVVRVLLQSGTSASITGALRVSGRRAQPARTYTVGAAAGGRVRVRLGRRSLSALVLRFAGRRPLRLLGGALNGTQGATYRGRLEVRAARGGGGVEVIDVLRLDDYARGVIGDEMSTGWPAQALEAQAVASRTYAMASHADPHGAFDVYADTRSQLYRGASVEHSDTDAAVAATARQVVTYGGRPVLTPFFDSSGGSTEDVSNVWPGGPPQPWLRGVPDPYDGGPMHSWGPVRLSFAQAAARLSGLVRGALRGIEVIKRGYSPRILQAEVVGSRGNTRVSGDTLAARLGLPDTWSYFSVADSSGEHPEPDLSGRGPAGASQPPPSPSGGATSPSA